MKACFCEERHRPLRPLPGHKQTRLWRVLTRNGNHSAFNGYRFTMSAYSALLCLRCHSLWRTKADYVTFIPDITDTERQKWLRGAPA